MAEVLEDIKNHCPFGCERHQLDERGYCRHLLGFTNDSKRYEPITPLLNRNGHDVGRVFIDGKKPQAILGTDAIVNPEIRQINPEGGGFHQCKIWVSSRVYRREPGDPVPAVVESPAPRNDDPPSWAMDMLHGMAQINDRLNALEESHTAPEAQLSEV